MHWLKDMNGSIHDSNNLFSNNITWLLFLELLVAIKM